jgi:hypothetical protein
MMSRFRFLYILRCLHLTTKGSFVTDKEDPAYDAIGKCRPILDMCVANFKALWNPGEYVSIDECMIPYNGKYCSFKQCLPLKPITHGIKLWVLADSCSKYVWNLEVYMGSENEQRGGLNAQPVHPMEMSAGIVMRLITGMEGKYYRLAMDYFFTSARLFDHLLQCGLYAIGTARQSCQGYSTSMNVTGYESRGTLQIRVHQDRKMAVVHWSDTKGWGPHPLDWNVFS